MAEKIKSSGGPTKYYDLKKGWVTLNDIMDYKAKNQWKEHSFHLGNIFKACYRWGNKDGTSQLYDAKKIVYSGLRLVKMLGGNEEVADLLVEIMLDKQFKVKDKKT